MARSGRRASDAANATNGDAATTALVVAKASSEGRSSFNESAASGSLPLTDADERPFEGGSTSDNAPL